MTPKTFLIPGKSIVGAHSIEELCSLLKRPRRVMLLVKAGPAVDDFIEALLPHLEKGTHAFCPNWFRWHHHRRRKFAFPRLESSMQIPCWKGVFSRSISTDVDSCSLEQVYLAVKKVLVMVLRWCLVVILMHGHILNKYSNLSLLKLMDYPAVTGSARKVRDIMSRWSIMGLNMVICN